MPISLRSWRKPLVETSLSRISVSLCCTSGWATTWTLGMGPPSPMLRALRNRAPPLVPSFRRRRRRSIDGGGAKLSLGAPMAQANPTAAGGALNLPNMLTYGRVAAVPVVVGAAVLSRRRTGPNWAALRAVRHRRDHRFLRRLSRPRLVAAILARPHARPDRRQAAGRRRAADAVGERHDRAASACGRRS